jgi:phage terminase large subunit-like protein
LANVFRALSILPASQRTRVLEALDPAELIRFAYDWMLWARDDQLPPLAGADGAPWRTWLILGGRGSGKTRAGAEWVRARALGLPSLTEMRAHRIALVGRTIGEVRDIMIEGVSGLMSVHAPDERPTYEISRNQLTWPNGTVAQMFAADDYETLRGPQFDTAWCDELAKWRQAERAWDNLQFTMRLGDCPQVCITTTPRASRFLKRLMKDPQLVVTRARTTDNAANLAPAFIRDMQKKYGGTPMGRQELDGEIVEERMYGLWKRSWIEQNRIEPKSVSSNSAGVGADRGRPGERLEMQRIVVAVDPPVTANTGSDSCGIVVAGIALDGRAVILADRTIQGRTPDTWARAAVQAYHDFEADRLVAEVNQGGDLVVSVIHQVDPSVPVHKVRATRGKWLRAEPVAQLYAEGRVAHYGTFPELERQMCDFATDGLSEGRSPDRLDALVWALTELMLTRHHVPTVRRL